MAFPPIDPALLSQLGQTPPGQAPAAGLGPAGDPSMMAPPSAAPSPYGMAPAGPGGAQPGANPQDQAVWDTFPSTDPSSVQQLLQQSGGDLGQFMMAWEQAYGQDEEALHQRAMQTLQMLLGQLSQPDQSAAEPPTPGPGVGGEQYGF